MLRIAPCTTAPPQRLADDLLLHINGLESNVGAPDTEILSQGSPSSAACQQASGSPPPPRQTMAVKDQRGLDAVEASGSTSPATRPLVYEAQTSPGAPAAKETRAMDVLEFLSQDPNADELRSCTAGGASEESASMKSKADPSHTSPTFQVAELSSADDSAAATSPPDFSQASAAFAPSRGVEHPLPLSHMDSSELHSLAELQDTIFNPFTLRQMSVHSTSAQLLFRVGFTRRVSNALQLEWSAAAYQKALLRTAAQHHREPAAAPQTSEEKALPHAVEAGGADSAAQGMEAFTEAELRHARRQLLQPLKRGIAQPWRSELLSLFAQDDFMSSLPAEVQRRYDAVNTVPLLVKLESSADPAMDDLTLSIDQQHTLQLALRGYHLFIGGSAGTGKTALLKVIYKELTLRHLRVALTAATGVAGIQLGGCTFHHAFGAPLRAGPHRWDHYAFRSIDVLILDEISLIDASLLDSFDVAARLARMIDEPFGGIQVIFCGDFLQLTRLHQTPTYMCDAFRHLIALQLVSPLRHGKCEELLQFVTELRCGRVCPFIFQQLSLNRPAAAQQDVTFLFPKRDDVAKYNDEQVAKLDAPEMHFVPHRGPLYLHGSFTDSALMEVPNAFASLRTVHGFREALFALLPRSIAAVCPGATMSVADHNFVVVPVSSETAKQTFFVRIRCGEGATPSPEGSITSSTPAANFNPKQWEAVASHLAGAIGGRIISFVKEEPLDMVPLSVTMALTQRSSFLGTRSSMTPVRLKVGCRVMINRNLSRTVSNGSIGVVESFAPPTISLFPNTSAAVTRRNFHQIVQQNIFNLLPVVRLQSGEIVQIPPVCTTIGGSLSTLYYTHDIQMIPIQLGYAFTVHKVQGLTLDGPVVFDCKGFFTCPHLIYVACSRVRQLSQLCILNFSPYMVRVDPDALRFSESLQAAVSPDVLNPPPHATRGAWTRRLKH